MRSFYVYTLALVLAMLAPGCVNAPRVDSIEDGIAVGYLTVESVANATAEAYQSGFIERAEKNRIRNDLQDAQNALDDGRSLLALGQNTEAQGSLDLAENILSALKGILEDASQ